MNKQARVSDRFSRLAAPLLAGLCFAGALRAPPLRAQAQPAQASAPSNRYLFIVESSRAMQPRADGVLNAVKDLLASGMSGQLRPGDTLGVWTFNAQLYTGQLPLQHWSPEGHKAVSLRILDFLRTQKYEKQAKLEPVLAAMERLVQSSEFITVILVSSGQESLRGTPFDEPANSAYKLWREQQQKARMPFVTVLRARSGKITDYAVTAAPWPLEMPPLPVELKLAQAVEKKPVAKAAAAPPLIFHGKSPEPANVEPPTRAPEAAKAQADPADSSKLAGALAGGTSNTPSAAAEAKVESTNSLSLTPDVQPKPAAILSPKAPVVVHATPEPVPNRLVEKHGPAFSTSAPAATRKPVPAPSAPSDPGTVAVPQVATAFWSRKGLWLAGGLLVCGSFGLGLLARRRSRRTGHISLITRSLERDRK